MNREIYSEGIKHLSSILLKAQGRPDAETKADIDIGYEVMRLREVLDGMNAKPQLPQDVEEFIAGNSQTDDIRDEYGDTHYKIDVVDVEDLRAWMSGHVRVPVELIEFIEAKEHHLPVEDRHVLNVMLNASKGE